MKGLRSRAYRVYRVLDAKCLGFIIRAWSCLGLRGLQGLRVQGHRFRLPRQGFRGTQILEL